MACTWKRTRESKGRGGGAHAHTHTLTRVVSSRTALAHLLSLVEREGLRVRRCRATASIKPDALCAPYTWFMCATISLSLYLRDGGGEGAGTAGATAIGGTDGGGSRDEGDRQVQQQ